MGFTGALVGSALIGAAGSAIAGKKSAKAQEKAAETQAASANRAADLQFAAQQQAREDFLPFLEFGTEALTPLERLEPRFRGFDERFDLEGSPVYQAQKNELLRTLGGEFAAGGLKKSSAFENALIRNQSPLIMGEYARQYGMLGDEYNRLLNRVKIGQGAAGSIGASGMQAAGAAGNALMAGGAAQARGISQAGQTQANMISGLSALPLQAYGTYQTVNALNQSNPWSFNSPASSQTGYYGPSQPMLKL